MIQRFNVREAICQMLDLTAFPFPANLSIARVRRQKNHSGKLEGAGRQLEDDGGIKGPEHARDQSIVSPQETNGWLSPG